MLSNIFIYDICIIIFREMRIAINGMGRIGRLLFKRLLDQDLFEIIAVNDTIPTDNLAYLLNYDSIYGPFARKVVASGEELIIGQKKIQVFQEPDPEKLPWKSLNIDVVLECSGEFKERAMASKHLRAGAKKVLLSTTGADDIPLKVFGFNQNNGVASLDILSPGGCMTNCSVHILYLLNSIGIRSAMINIIHSYTSRQELIDTKHKNHRRGRAAAESIIPVDIDLVQSLERLFPSLQHKINTYSTRVPVPNGAMAIFHVQLESDISREKVNHLFQKNAAGGYKGILDYTEEEWVSADIRGNTNSCIIDGTQTAAIGNLVKVVAWFDNEYGFTSRMIDWLHYWRDHASTVPG